MRPPLPAVSPSWKIRRVGDQVLELDGGGRRVAGDRCAAGERDERGEERVLARGVDASLEDANLVEGARSSGARAGVLGTPCVFVNGVWLPWERSTIPDIRAAVDGALAKADSRAAR